MSSVLDDKPAARPAEPRGKRRRNLVRRSAAQRRAASAAGGTNPVGPITLSVMRAMIAAADALGSYTATGAVPAFASAQLQGGGSELAEHVRKYQAATRQFIADWLRDVRQSAWLVEGCSGRILDTVSAGAGADGPLEATQVTVAANQQLHGLRRRNVRAGVGIPVATWTRRQGPDEAADLVRASAARPMTAVVSVVQNSDRRVRTVRVHLLDPVAVDSLELAGIAMPLAGDFTAPVAQTLGLERKPAANAYGLRAAARRGTIEGFSALTPFAPERVPLILLEGAGHSPLTMAQIANEVAGDAELRRRFQVWLYHYPMAAPLFHAARRFRDELESFHMRLEATAGRPLPGRGVVIAHGPGAVLAKTLLVDSGDALWDACFSSPLAAMELAAADRALLEALFFWQRTQRIERVIVAGEPRNADALAAGVGARAVQLFVRQSPELRSAIERIHWRQQRHLRQPVRPAAGDPAAASSEFPEPLFQSLSDLSVCADRALLSLTAGGDGEAGDVRVFAPASGLAPLCTQRLQAGPDVLGPQSTALVLDWLRPRH